MGTCFLFSKGKQVPTCYCRSRLMSPQHVGYLYKHMHPLKRKGENNAHIKERITWFTLLSLLLCVWQWVCLIVQYHSITHALIIRFFRVLTVTSQPRQPDTVDWRVSGYNRKHRMCSQGGLWLVERITSLHQSDSVTSNADVDLLTSRRHSTNW